MSDESPLTPHEQARFWAKVDKSGDCWEWQAQKTATGYGRFMRKIGPAWKQRPAHRISFVAARGPIDEGLVIDHLCHNTSCVRPEHLRATTPKKNNENRVGPNRNSKSGVRGVCWDKQSGRWKVQVGHGGRIYRGGFFDDLTAAGKRAAELRASLHSRIEAAA